LLHFAELWPFPAEAAGRALDAALRTVLVEANSTGQLGTLIRSHTGRLVDSQILRYDGQPFTPEYILSHES
jgi:2-oxoglutarate ferredoxin oxidoreductase subunit alpha